MASAYACGVLDRFSPIDDETLTTLHSCGFAVLRGLLPPALVVSLASHYSSHEGMPGADLLNGRREWLPPYAMPFSDDRILHHPALTALAAAYLGGDEHLDLDALTVTTAPGGTGRQPMHRDVLEGPAAVLTLHLPLGDLPSPSAGALALQPGTHGSAGRECEEHTDAYETSLRAGDAIVYDARICHCGTANARPRASGERPVLYLLWKRRDASLTGYLPHEVNLRFGRQGFHTVLDYREAFRERRDGHAGQLAADCDASDGPIRNNRSSGSSSSVRRRALREQRWLTSSPLAGLSPYLQRDPEQ